LGGQAAGKISNWDFNEQSSSEIPNRDFGKKAAGKFLNLDFNWQSLNLKSRAEGNYKKYIAPILLSQEPLKTKH
jgi:hypothetical protein